MLGVRSKNNIAGPPGASYNRSMTTEELKALPVDEKIRMMEAIWEDFRERFDRMEIPQEQKDLLDQRRARVREGKTRLRDWDSVKGTIGRR
jgi:putative addiction module component (TIGR02574 family)